MGERVVLGVLLRALTVLLVLAGVRCLPGSGDEVEWVQRPESIVIQKNSVFAEKFPYSWYGEVAAACGIPEFTLYGDGTLIFRKPGAFDDDRSVGLDYESTIYRARLDAKRIRDLFTGIEHDGFFDFVYEQPDPVLASAQAQPAVRAASATTYLYANTKSAANAVSASGINILGAPKDGGSEWRQYRSIERIAGRLDKLTLTLFAGDLLDFKPEGLLLVVKPLQGEPPEQPLPYHGSPSLAEVAPGPTLATRALAGDDAVPTPSGDVSQLIFGGHIATDNARAFYYCTRPLLPYEENFPEFDTP